MVDKIYDIKNKLLEHIEKEMGERGPERLDGDMVDMVKDLACAEKDCWEAEYYRAVTEAMERGEDVSGYMRQGMDVRQTGGRSGWTNQYGSGRSRRGYHDGMMDHSDPVDMARYALQMATPEERERIKAEMR